MTPLVYYILSGICVIMVLLGINMMSKVKLSVAVDNRYQNRSFRHDFPCIFSIRNTVP